MSRSLRVLVAVAALAAVGQGISLVARGSRGETDFGVFYRAARLLKDGAGAELYRRLDVVTTWPISLAPAGFALFQPLALLSPRGAGIGWAIVNLVLLGLTLVALGRLLQRAGTKRRDALMAWAAVLLVVLSAGSIQVGQFSVLFVAFWLFAMSALAAGRQIDSALFLALPTAIKLYPVLMLAVPVSLARTVRDVRRDLAGFVAGLILFSLAVPAVAYGSRAWPLNASFWTNVVLNPTGQVAYMQRVRTGSNQSVDTVLLRYFAFDSEFHVFFFPEFRHFDFSQRSVIRVAHVIRLVIVLITVAAVWRWRRRVAAPAGRDVLTMAAVWSCTLYLMLPETKARYAAYTFLGFIPLLECAIDDDGRSGARGYRIAEIVLCAMLIVGIVPEPVKTYGLGLAGPVVLWIANLRLMMDAEEWRARAGRILPAAAPWPRAPKSLRSSSES